MKARKQDKTQQKPATRIEDKAPVREEKALDQLTDVDLEHVAGGEFTVI